MSLRLAIFDLDGTLVDSRHNIIRAVEETAKACGLALPPAEMMPRVIGLALDEALMRLFPGLGVGELGNVRREFGDCFVRFQAKGDYDEALFAGAKEALSALQEAGVVLAIATGKGRRGAQEVLDRHGLAGHFVSIQTPETAPGKPHPGMVLQAMAEAGAEREATAMIGDTTFDIQMALAAGVRAIGVSWGNHPPEELTMAGAHRLIDRFSDLFPALDVLTSIGAIGAAP